MNPLFDRFYPYSQKPEFLNGKETALLSAAADETEKAFAGINATYRGCCEYLSWKDRGSVLAFQTWKIGDVRQGNWLQKAEALGERSNPTLSGMEGWGKISPGEFEYKEKRKTPS